MTIEDILTWYEGIDESRMDAEGQVVDIERMLYMRKQLAVLCCQVAHSIYLKEVDYKNAYLKKKIDQATIEYIGTGTVAAKKAKATIDTEAVTRKSDNLEAEIRGYKIKLDQFDKVLDSMAGYISSMRSL